MTYSPDPEVVLRSVIGALENEIGPMTSTEHAASLCRTAAQMLRQVLARSEAELPVLVEDAVELRALLSECAIETSEPPIPCWPDIGEARADVAALEARLAVAISSGAEHDSPVRNAAREFVARQLRRRLSWERDAFTGPRR